MPRFASSSHHSLHEKSRPFRSGPQCFLEWLEDTHESGWRNQLATMKPCSRCRAFKPLAEYDHARNSRDGHHHRCIKCDRPRDKQRHRNGSMKASINGWRKRNPHAVAAHKAVREAVKAGTLKRLPCCVCGSANVIHAHHDDWSKPLVVTWFCHHCHMEHHRLERLYGRGQGFFAFMEGLA